MITYFEAEFETNMRSFDLILQILITHWWWSGVLCMDADNDSCLGLNTNAETIGQKRHA